MEKAKIGFASIQLLKAQTLGVGSYGAVCKAKCDGLLCAAKILHSTLFHSSLNVQSIVVTGFSCTASEGI